VKKMYSFYSLSARLLLKYYCQRYILPENVSGNILLIKRGGPIEEKVYYCFSL